MVSGFAKQLREFPRQKALEGATGNGIGLGSELVVRTISWFSKKQTLEEIQYDFIIGHGWRAG